MTAARRRDESAQDVPVALSVVGAASLERRGAFTLGQIQQQVPSLQLFSFNPRNANVNIRGLGSNVALTNDGLENGGGFYIDNVYYGRVGTSQFDLVDLDRIEVLRGPQGTLFGKNTTSGVINVTSRKPSFEPEFSGEVWIGDRGYRQFRASGSTIPDNFATRAARFPGYTLPVFKPGDRLAEAVSSARLGSWQCCPDRNLSLSLVGLGSGQRW